MASKLVAPPSYLSRSTKLFSFSSTSKGPKLVSFPTYWRSKRSSCSRRMAAKSCLKVEEKSSQNSARSEWGKVSAVLFDMDGVLCNSEDLSRRTGVDVFAEMGVEVTVEDFVPFMGTGES